jgi:hypothetical protein
LKYEPILALHFFMGLDPDPHPHQGEKSNPDLHLDPHQSDADPQHCCVVPNLDCISGVFHTGKN